MSSDSSSRPPSADHGPRVWIALGSNQGDSRGHVWSAVQELQVFSDRPIRPSSLWETEPVDCPPGSSPFINAVVELIPRAGETPQSLLGKLQDLERAAGRLPKQVLNEARPLDLDIIAFGDLVVSTRELLVPHPRAHVRAFVLAPLSELAPDLILPGQSEPVRALLRSLGAGPKVRKLPGVERK